MSRVSSLRPGEALLQTPRVQVPPARIPGRKRLRAASGSGSAALLVPWPVAMSEVRRCWYLGAASAPVIMGRAQRQHVHVLEAAHHGLADLGHVGLPSRAPTFQNWRRVPAKPHEAPNLMSASLRLSKAMAFSFTPLRPSEAPRLSVLPRCVAPLRPAIQCCPTAAPSVPRCGRRKRRLSALPRRGLAKQCISA